MDAMTNDASGIRMSPDAAARQALRVALAEVLVVAENWRHVHLDARPGEETAEAAELLSQILGVLANRARGSLEADGADVDVLVEWVQADLADELT
jgi:hypothetical protein